MARVVVIGAGLAGLAAAIRLGDFGHRVTVLEGQGEAGGQAAAFRPSSNGRVDAVSVDTGPVTFTLPAVLRDLFRKTGRPIERCLDLAPANYGKRVVTPDGTTIAVPNASRAGAMNELDEQLGAGAGQQWDRAISAAGRLWDIARPLIERPFTARTAARMLTHPGLRPLTRQTLDGFGADHLPDPRLRQLLHNYAHQIAIDPTAAPAALASLAYLDQTFGVWTVDGGFNVLMDALATRADEKAADVRTGVSAQEIAVRQGRVTAVVTDDVAYDADFVVCAAAAPDLLLGRARPTRPVHGARSLLTVFVDGVSAADPVTVMDHELGAVTVSPAGQTSVTIHAPCPPHGHGSGEIDWSAAGAGDDLIRRMTDAASTAGVLADQAAQPAVVRTPLDLEHRTGMPGGRVCGTSWLATGRLLATPRTLSRIGGLVLAGGWTHPGPTVPFSIMSGGIAADHVGRA